MSKEDILKEITRIIRSELGVEYKIFLFGSWAKGTALETSDLDIGIFGPQAVAQDKLVKIRAAIEALPTLRKVDIVDFVSAGEEFRNNVLKHAKELNP